MKNKNTTLQTILKYNAVYVGSNTICFAQNGKFYDSKC